MMMLLGVQRSIFISYAHSDGVELAFRLHDALTAAGHQVWLDRSQLAGGVEWGREIERAIAQCDCELALLSEASFHSDICRAEQLMCLDAHKPIIPLLVQANAKRPVHLFAKHYYDFSDPAGFEVDFEKLASLLEVPDLQARYTPQLEQQADPVHRFIMQTRLAQGTGSSAKLPEAYRTALERHIGQTATAVSRHRGRIYRYTGEGYIALFPIARACLSCGRELAAGFAQLKSPADAEPLQLRIALHGGALQPVGAEYFGPALSQVSRICQVCYPGQVLLSGALLQAVDASNGAELVDLGLHYLNEVDEPEHLYQLVDDQFAVREFPPLLTQDRRPNNLVQQFSLFVGRARELVELKSLLLGGHRLVTITAPGGYGKSRLAVQLCSDLLPQFEHGVFNVELSPLVDPAQIVYQLAEAIRFKFYGSRDAEEQVIDYLRAKKLLLCMDNFEHLLAGAPLVSKIIQAAPHIRIVVTSRELLNIAGERAYELWPLPVALEQDLQDAGPRQGLEPAQRQSGGGSTRLAERIVDPAQLSDAARLFADRAVQRNASLAGKAASSPLIEVICAKLSGIPLAIELAAAWMDRFTLPELHDELSHQLELEARTSAEPARHHSLQACLDWSWKLLGAAQQEMLMQLAVFRGGFFSEAASALLNMKGMALRSALAKLCDKSWLYTREVDEQSRFFLRDMLTHEYVLIKLQESRQQAGSSQEESLYEQTVYAHAEYFVALVEREGPRLEGTGTSDSTAAQQTAINTWRLELENINMALESALHRQHSAWLLPMATYLHRYSEMTSTSSFARERYLALDQAARSLGNRILRLRACIGLGIAQWRLGQLTEARAALIEAQDLASQCSDRSAEAAALSSLGNVHYSEGDFAGATKIHSQALAIQREIGNRRGEACSHNNLSLVYHWQAYYALASEQASLALAIYRETGDRQGEAAAINNLGQVHCSQGLYDGAAELFSQALVICREIGEQRGEANALNNLGIVHYSQSGYAGAAELFSQATSIFRDIGDRQAEAAALSNLGLVYYWENDYTRASELQSQAMLLSREIGDQRGEANAFNNLGILHYSQDSYASAAELFRQALTIRREIKARVEVAVTCALAGACLAAQGMQREAAMVICTASACTTDLGHRFDPEDLAVINSGLARLDSAVATSQISAEQVAAWKAEGEALSLDELAEFTLDELEKLKDELSKAT